VDVRTALAALDRGSGVELDGRGVNRCSMVEQGSVAYSVKVHCLEESGDRVADRIRAADALLAGRPWYPAVVSLGHDDHGRLVVVRPFVEGSGCPLDRRTRNALASVARDLASVRPSPDTSDHLVNDHATAWLAGHPDDLLHDLAGRPALRSRVERWLPQVLQAARRLDDGPLRVGHGDLHVRNLVSSAAGLVLVDWDEVALTRRPTDAAKAMWLVTRHERGAFDLDPRGVEDWLTRTGTAGVPRDSWRDLALLGAAWFLPRAGHVDLLGRREPEHVEWYLGWVERFWTSLDDNLALVDRLARRRGPIDPRC
jgi:aminoglycoside phosphotransferase (APT) family kinase protein